jgi:hypothetical protein
MQSAPPLCLLVIFSTLVFTATGAPNTGCFYPKVVWHAPGSNWQRLCDHDNGKHHAADVTCASLPAQALQTQVLMSMRATHAAEALAWARLLATLQDPWSGSWPSVICWSDTLNVAQMRGMRLRRATVGAPPLVSGASVPVRQASCRTSFPLCTLCNPFTGVPACLICQQPLSVANDGSCGARFTLQLCTEAGVVSDQALEWAARAQLRACMLACLRTSHTGWCRYSHVAGPVRMWQCPVVMSHSYRTLCHSSGFQLHGDAPQKATQVCKCPVQNG